MLLDSKWVNTVILWNQCFHNKQRNGGSALFGSITKYLQNDTWMTQTMSRTAVRMFLYFLHAA